VGSPTARESQGDGGLVVVVGVTPYQGAGESPVQGEGAQVSATERRGGRRNADGHILFDANRFDNGQALESVLR